MHSVLQVAQSLHHFAADGPGGGIPTGGPPAPLPGKAAEKVSTLLSWAAWVVAALCVGGIMIVAGRMAVMHRRGEGGAHASGLAWVAGACILVGSAGAIVGALFS
jgi:hypothetical protein